jgi:hypothetical protein
MFEIILDTENRTQKFKLNLLLVCKYRVKRGHYTQDVKINK